MKLDKNKKESPQQGEYIDLKNTEYKKRTGLASIDQMIFYTALIQFFI